VNINKAKSWASDGSKWLKAFKIKGFRHFLTASTPTTSTKKSIGCYACRFFYLIFYLSLAIFFFSWYNNIEDKKRTFQIWKN